jgi:hypothetical protein
MTQSDLIKQAFGYLNSFKRARALEQVKREASKYEDVNYQKLQQYMLIDQLELALRAIQKNQYSVENNATDAKDDEEE